MKTKILIALAFGCLVLAAPEYLRAQQDQSQESVADAARKARAEKKTAPKPAMSIDNDNLDTLTGVVSVVGEAPPADQAKNGDKTAKAGEKPAKNESYWRQKFAAANKKLADDAHEADILQREYNLKQEQFYTDPMASLKQEYSRQDLNDTKAKIDEKTAAVEQDKTDIANLEDELRQSGGDPGWATPLSQPASDSAPSPTPDSTPAPAPPAQSAPQP